MLNFLKTNTSKIILGIIWGFGLACLFHKACTGRNCIIYKAPNVNTITNNIYKHDDTCYKYSVVNSVCNKNVIDA